jgi:hypothetical protein
MKTIKDDIAAIGVVFGAALSASVVLLQMTTLVASGPIA